MKGIILAAGYATRLYPLTRNFPKPLLKVRGKSILEYLLEDLSKEAGIDRFILVSNHRYAEHFSRFAEENTYPLTVLDDGTETNETRLGAVRDLELAVRECASGEDLLVAAGDNLLDFSLRRFLDYAKERGTSCIMRYYEPDEARLRHSGVVTVDDRALAVAMEEKPEVPASHWCVPPFYYLKAEDAALTGTALEDGCGSDSPGRFIAWLCAHRPVHAMVMPGKRYDIGDIRSYQAAELVYQGITV